MARRCEFYVRVAALTREILYLLYRHIDDSVFDDFPKISDHFPKILQNLFKGHTNVAEHFPTISEGARRLAKTFEEDPKMR